MAFKTSLSSQLGHLWAVAIIAGTMVPSGGTILQKLGIQGNLGAAPCIQQVDWIPSTAPYIKLNIDDSVKCLPLLGIVRVAKLHMISPFSLSYFTYISLEKLARSLETTDGDHISRSRNVELAIHKIHYLLSRIPPLETEEGKSGYEMWSESGFSSRDIDGQKLSGVSHGGGKHGIENTCNDGVLSKSHIAKKMKTKFTKAWTSLLRLSLPLEVYKEVLANLYKVVIPHFSNPVMLCDFLTRSYDIGGVISVMALSGLYILMTEHGLEYPNFYDKLYMLLAPSIFMAKHRSKFFKLLDSCLKSSLLPAYLAAAFTKKLSRLALIVPPSGALVIIALIHNLLRRHPSINHLVHQVTNDESNEDTSRGGTGFSDTVEEYGVDPDSPITKQGVDLFNCEENDPLKSNAMSKLSSQQIIYNSSSFMAMKLESFQLLYLEGVELTICLSFSLSRSYIVLLETGSSLWEIETLRHHYCPAVSRFVASLENDLTIRAKTAEVDVEDFSSGSYATIFNEEMRRRVKQVPLAVYPTEATPTSLFRESDFPGWTFRFDTTTKQQQSKNKENGAITMSGDDNIKSAKKRRTV
ncbi:hypothetical protein GIB67_026799 [Kingdonia uniflora]|uniref:CCAAT-binding factor domain-containing protein n=1 Tax=Kingdonia uniflora TaxID=39325 RepID=A0A7J7MHF9_9MAGN|nr:hypothetical protein GIB67_026799 [Kingdonia uniflora]